MNKTKLAETGIMVVIIVLIYQLVLSVISAITGIYFMVTTPFPRMGGSIYIQLFFPVILYLSAIYLLYFYKSYLARWLAGNDEQQVILNVSPLSVLYITLFSICMVSLLSDLPTLLSQSIAGNHTPELQSGLDIPDNRSSGFGEMLNISNLELYIRLLLAVIVLAIVSAKLFSGLRNNTEKAA